MFGVPDERLGEVPAAVDLLRGRARSRRQEALRAFLDGRIAAFKIPPYIWVHDEPLPKLGTGKIDKMTLRERYRRSEPTYPRRLGSGAKARRPSTAGPASLGRRRG